MTPLPGLARCVGDVEQFATRHWGLRPLFRRQAGSFEDLLDIASVERLLTDLGRRPSFRVVRAGTPIHPSEYTTRTRVGGVVVDDVADVDRILDLVAAGATIVMQGLQRYWPPLSQLCLEIEADASHAVQANAYLSPPDSAGLTRHADDHDVISLQVTGGKRWDVDGLGEIEACAGDVLYLPAGVDHAARTVGEHSLHITLGLLTTTYRQVLRRILDGLDADELDRPLPLGFASPIRLDELVSDLEHGVHTTIDALGKHDLVGAAEAEIERRRRRMRTRRTGRLHLVVQPELLRSTSYVRRCSDGPIDVVDDTATMLLVTPDRRLRMPRMTSRALEVVAAREWFQVADLPGLDPDDRLTLVRRLVREGILQPA